MTPEEIVEQITDIGGNVSRPTLTRYENWGLISKPRRGSMGRGLGRWTDYPDIVVAEAFAAWSMINGKYTDLGLTTLAKLSPQLVFISRFQAIGQYKHENRNYTQIEAYEKLLTWETENGKFKYSELDHEEQQRHKNTGVMKVYIKLLSFTTELWDYEFKRAYSLYSKLKSR